MAKYNTIMFDLDGTLIPFDQDEFIREYFGRLARKMVPLGYEKDSLIKAIWAGTNAMLENDGAKTNRERFFEVFGSLIDGNIDEMEKEFDRFYAEEFYEVKSILKSQADRSGLLTELRKRGFKLVLATNPLFPKVAVEARLSWVGLKWSDFEYITTYENSHYSKPNPGYYKEILHNINSEASKSIMIGNNPVDDMQAVNAGLDVYLVTDNLENQTNEDITPYNQGSFDDMANMLLKL